MIVIRHFSKLFSIIGQIMAFLTVAIIGIVFLNDGVFRFLSEEKLAMLRLIKEYAVLATLIVVGFAFASKRNIIFFILYCILAAVAVGFSFPALVF